MNSSRCEAKYANAEGSTPVAAPGPLHEAKYHQREGGSFLASLFLLLGSSLREDKCSNPEDHSFRTLSPSFFKCLDIVSASRNLVIKSAGFSGP
eukprot:3956349-Amphidinium_carterae.1